MVETLNRKILIRVQEYQRNPVHRNPIVTPQTRRIKSHGNGLGICLVVRARRAEVAAPPGIEIRDALTLYRILAQLFALLDIL